MAFGKDTSVLAQAGSFRQATTGLNRQQQPAMPAESFRQSSRAIARNVGGPKRSRIPYFVDMYRPSTMTLDTVRLVPGRYIQERLIGEGDNIQCVAQMGQFTRFVEHYDGYAKAGGICSAGPWANFKEKRNSCYGCDIFWETVTRNEQGRLESTRISRQNKFAFSIFDFSVYHKVEQLDRSTGQVKVSPRDNKPYMNWVKCQGTVCQGCREKKETRVGNMTHWPINFTQLEVLRGAASNIGLSCVRCGTENIIRSLSWQCRGCGDNVIDMNTTTMTLQEIQDVTDNPFNCQCGHSEVLEELFECAECTRRGQLGARASIFDVNLKIQVVETGQNDNKVLQVGGWSAPGPVPVDYARFIVPVDLLSRYAPTSLEDQARIYGYVPGGSAAAADAQGQGAPAPGQAPGQPPPQRQPVTGTPLGDRQYHNPYAPPTQS